MSTAAAATERQDVQLACFRVGGELYALDIMKIREIIRPQKLTVVPKAPRFIEGVINLRGVVIPVADLRKRFDHPCSEDLRKHRIIMCSVFGRIVGLLVDEVLVLVAGRVLGERIPTQVRFADWVFALLDVCRRQRYSVFFLGAADGVAQKASERLQRDFVGLRVVGVHAGYFGGEDPAGKEVVRIINARRPDVLLTGMSMPVEEQWVAANRDRLQAGVIVLGAGCFEWLSGNISTAPAWISTLYLEWFYRLMQEPRRLWRRYLLGNPKFILRVFRQYIEVRLRDR